MVEHRFKMKEKAQKADSDTNTRKGKKWYNNKKLYYAYQSKQYGFQYHRIEKMGIESEPIYSFVLALNLEN